MWTVDRIQREINALISSYNVLTPEAQIDRAIRRLGQTRFRQLRLTGEVVGGSIGISRFVLDGGNDDLVMDTIRHECAHWVAVCSYREKPSHGPVWRSVARSMGHSNPTPCTEIPEDVKVAPKYVYQCVQGDCKINAHRARPRVESARCAKHKQPFLRWNGRVPLTN